MKALFCSRLKRQTASVMLFVWLMALGIGLANACRVQQDVLTREHAIHTHPVSSHADLAEHLALEPSAAYHEHVNHKEPSLEDPACLDFCEAQQSAAVTDNPRAPADPDLAPEPFTARLLMPADRRMSPFAAFGRLIGSEPPVSIRYLRLTI